MSKRYYLCDIIGDGTEDNPYRPAVSDFGVSHIASIDVYPPGHELAGQPKHRDCLVLVSTENHAVLRSDSRIDALPDFALDGKLNAINNAARNGMMNALSRRGFDVQEISNAEGYRDALQRIGGQRSAAFNVDRFDVR